MKDIRQIHHIQYKDSNERIEAIQPLEECSLQTEIGLFTPVYYVEDHGRKKLSPVKYNRNGSIKSMSLQEAQRIETSVGVIEAELVTFYPDGSLKRLFPLNGKISGYWTEEDEYKLAESLTIQSTVGELNVKPINLQFYKTGELQSITFWPKERVEISSEYGRWMIRTGISFHKDGSLASCEPAKPVSIMTPIGTLKAFDPDPNGLCGESNSLSFSENGDLSSCSTIETAVKAIDNLGCEYSFEPQLIRSYCSDDAYMVQPLKIDFQRGYTEFKNGFKSSRKVSMPGQFYTEIFTAEKKQEIGIPCSC